MDPLLILFGFGVGMMVGMTGMGGGSLMTPLLVLLFGVKPTLAVGTDIGYQAITKTVGGFKHFKLKTVNFGAVLWLALGSVPGAIFGVWVIRLLHAHVGRRRRDLHADRARRGARAGRNLHADALAAVPGVSLQRRTRITSSSHGWQKAVAIIVGLVTGFVIGITSAGSGTVIAVALIAIFKLPPRYVVGTDVFQAAILLWAAGIAHFASGNIDFGLMGTLLIGSIPGVYIGSNFSVKVPESTLRTALGVVLIASAAATLTKAEVPVVPNVLIAATAIAFISFLALMKQRPAREPVEDEAPRRTNSSKPPSKPNSAPARATPPPPSSSRDQLRGSAEPAQSIQTSEWSSGLYLTFRSLTGLGDADVLLGHRLDHVGSELLALLGKDGQLEHQRCPED